MNNNDVLLFINKKNDIFNTLQRILVKDTN